ncbi:unnamed protein product [Rangifer tarandus platyrhynchus]|uniref:Uncharacterized protein n=1 Tax=Rangifer tarandus platyrhynchus TaxID=3082113 RepID=A0AC59YVC7_RANTA
MLRRLLLSTVLVAGWYSHSRGISCQASACPFCPKQDAKAFFTSRICQTPQALEEGVEALGSGAMTAGLTEACGGVAHPELSSFWIDVHVSESGSPHP